jgi:hypothetical protein
MFLFSEFNDLVAPSIQTIKELGDTTEKASVMIGISEIGNMSISVREDFANHTEGFWFKALKGECWLKIYLDEGAGDTFYFFGIVDNLTINWSEFSITADGTIRTCQFTILAMSSKLFQTDVNAWITDVLANKSAVGVDTLGEASHVMKLTEMFECMLTASGLNATYDASDVTLVYGSQAEIDFGEGIGHYRVDQIYLPVQYVSSTGPTVFTKIQYFDTTNANCLAQQSDGSGYYDTLKALLTDLLTNFGLLMRMDFNLASDRHLIKLMHRHDVYTGTLTFGNREKQPSNIKGATILIGDAIRAADLTVSTNLIWQSKKYGRFPSPNAPPQVVKFDVDARCIFIVSAAGINASNHSILKWAGAGNAAVYMTGVRYYSTISGLMTEALSSNPLKMQDAVCEYQYERFTQEFRSITRTYARMEANDGSTTTHEHLSIMRRTQINDLATNEYYFANSVTKKPMSAEVTIEWLQEDLP